MAIVMYQVPPAEIVISTFMVHANIIIIIIASVKSTRSDRVAFEWPFIELEVDHPTQEGTVVEWKQLIFLNVLVT